VEAIGATASLTAGSVHLPLGVLVHDARVVAHGGDGLVHVKGLGEVLLSRVGGTVVKGAGGVDCGGHGGGGGGCGEVIAGVGLCLGRW
jgi:hypothetical protein